MMVYLICGCRKRHRVNRVNSKRKCHLLVKQKGRIPVMDKSDGFLLMAEVGLYLLFERVCVCVLALNRRQR